MINIENILKAAFDEQTNSYYIGNEPHIYHCHHYNCFLQLSMETISAYIDTKKILINSASETIFSVMCNIFKNYKVDTTDERLKIVVRYFSKRGFGILDLSTATSDGGIARCPYEHYSISWIDKFGARDNSQQGVSYFASGYIAGALDAVYSYPNGTFTVEQTACLSKNDNECRFKITKNKQALTLEPSPAKGCFEGGFNLQTPSDSSFDYKKIQKTILSMPLEPDERGMIESFGVYLTLMPANYYSLISYRVLFELEHTMGEQAVQLVEDLLKEAGHVCSFNTYGGIMESSEWEALILPGIKKQEDWIHGLIGIINSFGWGFYQLNELDTNKKMVLRINNGYESNFFLKKYGNIKSNISYLATGGAAGIMNLIYNAHIHTSPELSPEFYEKIFKSDKRFIAQQTKCRVKGDEYDEITISRMNNEL